MTSPSQLPKGTTTTTTTTTKSPIPPPPPPPVPQADFDPGVPSSSSSTSTTNAYPDPPCPFCHISRTYPPYDPASPPPPSTSSPSPISPSLTSPQPSTFVVLSTPHLIAFLDIMPLSHGHILLCTRTHREKLTDVTPHEARELGRYLRVLSAAVSRATGVADWNVVQNNGAAAAQVVPHMHFHVIPRPELRSKGRERFTSTMFGRGQREDLDEDEAEALAERVRIMVREVVEEEERGEKQGGKDSKL